MSDLKFSVVIPVYNCEDTIRSCLDSILLTNQAELEVVAVDDGSSDQSGAVLDQYAREGSPGFMIHQNNMGNSFSEILQFRIRPGIISCSLMQMMNWSRMRLIRLQDF